MKIAAIMRWVGLSMLCFLLALDGALAASAQSMLDRARKQAQRSVENRVERRTSEAVETVLDEVEGRIVCSVTDQECIDRGMQRGGEVVIQNERGETVETRRAAQPGASASAGRLAAPGDGVWTNYDFVPGDRILFYEDFSRDRVGRFPRRLDFRAGMMQVVEWEGQQLLQSTSRESVFRIDLGETLPERFTVEFDAYVAGRSHFARIAVLGVEAVRTGLGDLGVSRESYFQLGWRAAGVFGPSPSSRARLDYLEAPTPIRIAVDGRYATLYVNEERVANVPNAEISRPDFLLFVLGGETSQPSYIGNIRIAAGGLELYERLINDGRVSTQGIYFDTGSAAIRPESTGTLDEIVLTLRQHPQLRLRIEGHTDGIGNPDTNLRLSQQRADAVRNHLVLRGNIQPGRLEAVGLGQQQPVASDDTAEGRQTNRRVDLVRLD